MNPLATWDGIFSPRVPTERLKSLEVIEAKCGRPAENLIRQFTNEVCLCFCLFHFKIVANTFTFLKVAYVHKPSIFLLPQLNELKSFRRKEKNTHPTIIIVIKSGNYNLAFLASVTGLQPLWASKDSERSNRIFWSPFIHDYFMLRLLFLSRKEYLVYPGPRLSTLTSQALLGVFRPAWKSLPVGLGHPCPSVLRSASDIVCGKQNRSILAGRALHAV